MKGFLQTLRYYKRYATLKIVSVDRKECSITFETEDGERFKEKFQYHKDGTLKKSEIVRNL